MISTNIIDLFGVRPMVPLADLVAGWVAYVLRLRSNRDGPLTDRLIAQILLDDLRNALVGK
jgi:hypothetical protein